MMGAAADCHCSSPSLPAGPPSRLGSSPQTPLLESSLQGSAPWLHPTLGCSPPRTGDSGFTFSGVQTLPEKALIRVAAISASSVWTGNDLRFFLAGSYFTRIRSSSSLALRITIGSIFASYLQLVYTPRLTQDPFLYPLPHFIFKDSLHGSLPHYYSAHFIFKDAHWYEKVTLYLSRYCLFISLQIPLFAILLPGIHLAVGKIVFIY